MVTHEIFYITDSKNPFTGRLYVMVYLDGLLIGEKREEMPFTYDIKRQIANKPRSIRAHMTRGNKGIIKIDWETESELTLAIYIETSLDNWERVLEFNQQEQKINE